MGALLWPFEPTFGTLTNHSVARSLSKLIVAIQAGEAVEAAWTEAGPKHNYHTLLRQLVQECRGPRSKVSKLDLQVR